jgi:membrane-bound ClpP family serine protease
MSPRLIFAIVTTILEEAALALIGLWGLPKIGIHLPPFVTIVIMVLWFAYGIFTYQMGSRALTRKHFIGLSTMVGCQGEVVIPLTPDGMVRIKGELWSAKSLSGEIQSGEEVTVTGQDGLKLIVRTHRSSDSA